MTAEPPTLVTTTRQGPVTIVTMDDGRANALGPPMVAALNAALDEAEADAEVASVVIAGRPGRFSGGFDLELIRSGDTEAVKAMVRGGGDLIRRIYGGPLPVVAACTGHAVAAGALLLLGCDERIGPDATNGRTGDDTGSGTRGAGPTDRLGNAPGVGHLVEIEPLEEPVGAPLDQGGDQIPRHQDQQRPEKRRQDGAQLVDAGLEPLDDRVHGLTSMTTFPICSPLSSR